MTFLLRKDCFPFNFLGTNITKYDSVYQIALSRHNFEKFMIKVAKKLFHFNVFWHIVTTIYDVLEKF